MVFSKAPKKVDKTPYTVYEGAQPTDSSLWAEPYLQFVSVDPATKNFAIRVERRYFSLNGEKSEDEEVRVETLLMAKQDVSGEKTLGGETHPSAASLPSFLTAPSSVAGEVILSQTFSNLNAFLSKFEEFYPGTHIFVIERQLPENYKSTRIAQHALSYLMNASRDSPLRPLFVEVDPQLKGRQLGAPKGTKGPQLKRWSILEARAILAARRDVTSLSALIQHKNKQDDLADTVCQVEALCSFWGLPVTKKMEAEEAEAVISEIVPPPPKAQRKPRATKAASGEPAPARKPRAKKVSTPLLPEAVAAAETAPAPAPATDAFVSPPREAAKRGRPRQIPQVQDRVRAVRKREE